jgi:4-aminobutyrate aminotransferase-like enzyme
MVAVEFSQRESGEPHGDFAKRVQAEALKRRLILLTCGVDGNVIRFLFPLTIASAHFDEAVEILKVSLRSAVSA